MFRTGFIAAAFALAACGSSGPATHFTATLNAANETTATTGNTAAATGTATYTVNGTTVSYSITYSGLTGAPSAGHVHVGPAGVAGQVVVPFSGLPAAASGTFTGSFTAADVKTATGGNVSVTANNLDELLTAMRAGNTYTNLHTSTNGGGEIRGQNQPY